MIFFCHIDIVFQKIVLTLQSKSASQALRILQLIPQLSRTLFVVIHAWIMNL